VAFAGRVALVTGATRGIGREIAMRHSHQGAAVAVGYGSDREAAERLAGELGNAVAVGGDLADAAVAGRLVDEAEAALGSVDVLVANAGVAPRIPFEEISLGAWDRVHAVNLRAPFLLAQRVAPGMRERGFGRILFVSSVAAYVGGFIGPHYASSKAGLHGLAYGFSKALAPHGVTVNVLVPALVDTDMLPDDPALRDEIRSWIPVGRFGRADEVAELGLAILANAYVTGQAISADGGVHPR
jgi:3-oxoacyl-[acyl-carrier protein] reductase